MADCPVDKQADAQAAVDNATVQIGKCEATYRESAVQAGPARGFFYKCSSVEFALCNAIISDLEVEDIQVSE